MLFSHAKTCELITHALSICLDSVGDVYRRCLEKQLWMVNLFIFLVVKEVECVIAKSSRHSI